MNDLLIPVVSQLLDHYKRMVLSVFSSVVLELAPTPRIGLRPRSKKLF